MNKLYVIILSAVFAAATVVFCFFPRSTYSPLEKRDLASFPEFSVEKLFSGEYTRAISSWFGDSEAYRDELMALSMHVQGLKGIVVEGEDNVVFHAANDAPQLGDDNRTLGEYHNNITADENAKIASAGIIIVGSGANVRALMAFGGGEKAGTPFANLANVMKESLGQGVNVYCMSIPIATDFYIPEKAKRRSNSQRTMISYLYSLLRKDVKAVDVYTELSKHVEENIYLRTDHHWAALGAHYAARKFAEVAGVPFKDITHYEKRVVHNVVGSMYGYSKDIAVKNAPEDFFYYVPKGVTYTTTFVTYSLTPDFRIKAESKPQAGEFFAKYKDGSSGAYCTFMGGDQKIVSVKTSTHNGRRLVIIKDSYGNAIPSNLFFSFEEIHVIDFRYFTRNLKNYISTHRITDLLLAFNTFNSCSAGACNRVAHFLTQADGANILSAAEAAAAERAAASRPASAVPADAGVPFLEEAEREAAPPAEPQKESAPREEPIKAEDASPVSTSNNPED